MQMLRVRMVLTWDDVEARRLWMRLALAAAATSMLRSCRPLRMGRYIDRPEPDCDMGLADALPEQKGKKGKRDHGEKCVHTGNCSR